MPTGFIFDVEGTLIDCVPQVLDSWAEAFSEQGLSVERSTLQHFSGMDPDQMLGDIMPELDAAARKELTKRQTKIYRASFLHRLQAFPHAGEVLQTLHGRGHRLALATTCDAEELGHYRKLIDAEDSIAVFACGDDVKRGKPDPALLQLALQKLETESAVAVGDTPYDAIAAGRAGIPCLGVLTGGFLPGSLREAGCKAVYPDVASLGKDFATRDTVASS